MKNLKSKVLSAILATMLMGIGANANESAPEIIVEEVPVTTPLPELAEVDETDAFIIPNSPMIKPNNIITLRAIGLGVAPETAKNKAHAMTLAKRAAIVDAYRQMGEKLHGIKITARDTIKDAMIKNSVVRTKLYSVVRNGEIMETIYNDGLCQVEMEVQIDGRRWYRALASAL